jgi:hypothetical protein
LRHSYADAVAVFGEAVPERPGIELDKKELQALAAAELERRNRIWVAREQDDAFDDFLSASVATLALDPMDPIGNWRAA